MILPFEEFMDLLDGIKKYIEKNNIQINAELPIEKYLTQERKCLCGNTSIYINWDGEVYPCAFTEGNMLWGNIRKENIQEIIEKNKNFNHKNEFCKNCLINRYQKYERKTKVLVD